MTTSVISVGAYAENDVIAKAISESDYIRQETLRRCYAIPSYADKNLAAKTRYYDRIRAVVIREREGRQ